MILVLLTGLFFTGCGSKSTKPTIDLSVAPKKQVDNLGEDKAFLVALNQGANGIKANSQFELTIKDQPMTKEHIETHLKLDGDLAYELKPLNRETFQIRPKKALKGDTIINFTFEDLDEKEYAWAFQVEKEFVVEGSIPANMAEDVPTNAGIEIKFSMDLLPAADDYFEISPKVDGKLEVKEGILRFVPEKLEPNTVYEIKIKKGYGNSETEQLKEDYILRLKTASGDEAIAKEDLQFGQLLSHKGTQDNIFFILRNHGGDKAQKEKEATVKIYAYTDAKDYIQSFEPFYVSRFYFWEPSFTSLAKIDTGKMTPVQSFNTTLVSEEESFYNGYYLTFPDKMEEGMYLVEVSTEEGNYQTHLQVHSANIYTGVLENGMFIWANEVQNKRPVAGANIGVYGKNIKAKTGQDGTAFLSYDNILSETERAYLTVDTGSKTPYITILERSEYYYYGYGNIGDPKSQDASIKPYEYWSYLSLDRALYHPTDQIRFFGVFKERKNKKAVQDLKVEITRYFYGESKEIAFATQEIKTNEFGAFDGKIDISDYTPGYYTLSLKAGGHLFLAESFEVRNFEKPMYQFSAVMDKKYMFEYEPLTIDVKANFFEGRGVPNLKMSYQYYYGNKDTRVDFQLDAQGEKTIALKKIGHEERCNYNPKGLWIDVLSKDLETEQVHTSIQGYVFPRDRMVRGKVESQDASGNEITLKIQTNDIKKPDSEFEGGWVSEEDYTGKAVDVPVIIDVLKYNWEKVKLRDVYDPIEKKKVPQYEYQRREEKIETFATNTIKGQAEFKLMTDKEKSYEINFKIQDKKGEWVYNQVNYNFEHFNMRNSNLREAYYEISEENQSYYDRKLKVGEKLTLKLKKNDKEMTLSPDEQVIFMTLKNGLEKYVKGETKATYEITFKEEDIPNIYAKAIFFDGVRYHSTWPRSLAYDYEEESLDVSMTSDQEKYKPGDTITLDFNVKDKNGKAKEAYINVAIVDESIFSIAPQDINFLATLYRYVNTPGVFAESMGNDAEKTAGMAEGGGEGGGPDLRTDFKDTALYESIKTDKNGKATLQFKAPDNITAWRITYQAMTKDLKAVSGKSLKKVGKPYFIHVIANDFYLTGDEPGISVRSYGSDEKSIDYEIKLTKDNNTVMTDKKTFFAEETALFRLPALEEGTYKLTVWGKGKKASDGLEKEIHVVESMFKTTKVEEKLIEKNTSLPQTGMQSFILANADNGVAYRILLNAHYQWGQRFEKQAGKAVSQALLEQYFEDKTAPNYVPLQKYQLESGGIAPLTYGEEDVTLSGLVMAFPRVGVDRLTLSYFLSKKLTEPLSDEAKAAALWGLATDKKPVLLAMEEMLKANPSDQAKLYLALGFEAIGDRGHSKEIYMTFQKEKTKSSGDALYIEADNEDLKSQNTMLMALLASRLKQRDYLKYLTHAFFNPPKEELSLLPQLMLAENRLANTVEGYVVYQIGDEEKKVTLKGRDLHTLELTAENAAQFSFKDAENALMLNIAQIYAKDIPNQTKDFSVEKKYYNDEGKEVYEFKQGDRIKVVLTPQFSSEGAYGSYEITDRVPYGLSYSIYGQENNVYEYDRNVYGHFNYTEKEGIRPKEVVYYMNVTNPGKYRSEGPIMKKWSDPLIYVAPSQNLTVAE